MQKDARQHKKGERTPPPEKGAELSRGTGQCALTPSLSAAMA